MPYALIEISGEHFQPFVGQTLRFLRPLAMAGSQEPNLRREAVDLTLLDVRVSRFPGMRGKRQPFSLLLTMRDASPLDDKLLHALEHPEFEPCELLVSRVMVPELEKHDGTMYYEVVFA